MPRPLLASKVTSTQLSDYSPLCPRCGRALKAKGKSQSRDGFRMCEDCRRNHDPIWYAVFTGAMTYDEAVVHYADWLEKHMEDDDDEDVQVLR